MNQDKNGVLLVSFDLPTTDSKARADYRKFRKYLQTKGYSMLQESTYVKLLHHASSANSEMKDIERNAPQDGEVFVLPLTLTQFKNIKYIRGTPFNFSLFSDDIFYI